MDQSSTEAQSFEPYALEVVDDAWNEALRFEHAVDRATTLRLAPEAPGLYIVWAQDGGLLYVGAAGLEPNKPSSLRKRLTGYLKGARLNETLYVHLVNEVLRPNLQQDKRKIQHIAAEYLIQECRFAWWAWDGEDDLRSSERCLRRYGVAGQLPLLNPLRS